MATDNKRSASVNADLYAERLQPGEIRLLHIDQSTDECSFRTYDLEDAPKFYAISYTWELSESDLQAPSSFEQHRQHPQNDQAFFVAIDGVNHRVTQNIRFIVDRIIEGKGIEFVWIDYLSIDQSDPIERSAQVSIMGDIYQAAHEVLVWLGWDDRNEVDAIVVMCTAMQNERIRQADGSMSPNFRNHKVNNLFEPAILEELGFLDPSSGLWQKLAHFWNRRWFHRGWVVQEVTLAKTARFFFGRNELHADMLYAASCYIMDAEIGLAGGLNDTQTITRPQVWFTLSRKIGETLAKSRALQLILDYAPEERRLDDEFWRKCDTLAGPESIRGRKRTDCMRLWSHMLEICRAFDVTDPRDHIYASLGIIKATARNHGLDPPPIIVDYSRTVSEVFADAAKHIMEAGDGVHLLSLCQDPTSRNLTDIPSWVPDFSAGTELPIHMTKATRLLAMPSLRRLIQRRNEDPSPCFKVQDNLRVLQVHAMQIDEVVSVGESQDEIVNSGLWEKIGQIMLSQSSFSRQNPNESRVESLWRTLVANTSSERDGIAPAEMAEDFKALLCTSLIVQMLQHPHHHLDRIPSWKRFTEEEMQSSDGPHAALASFEYVVELTREADRRWREIEGGGPVPDRNPIAARAFKFANAMEAMYYRRVILTRGGYLGIGPMSTLPGDSVWVMPDAPLPKILKKFPVKSQDSTGGDSYALLGEAYLHGDPDFEHTEHSWQWIDIH